MKFVEYEKANNQFLCAFEKSEFLQLILDEVPECQRAILIPQNIALDDVEITASFARAHIARIDPQNHQSFTTLNSQKGAFSDALDSISFEAFKNNPACTKIHVLRQIDHSLSSGRKLNIFLISDCIRFEQPTTSATVSAEASAMHTTSTPIVKTSFSSTSTTITTTTSTTVPSVPALPMPELTPSSNPYNFQSFVDKMRNRKAANLVKQIKMFINEIDRYKTEDENLELLPQRVRSFMTQMYNSIQAHPLWKGGNTDEMENAMEGLEKYIMTKLHPIAFCPSATDIAKDDLLKQRLNDFSFITASNLDVNSAVMEHTNWNDAIAEIRRINSFKTPRDKLICITNCCKIIFNVLHACEPVKIHGADDFLPCLILLICKANPPHLHSNLKYIQDYRMQAHFETEAGYYFTAMQSVVFFWENVVNEPTTLHLSADQMKAIIQSNEKLTESESSISEKRLFDDLELPLTMPTSNDASPELIHPSSELKGAGMTPNGLLDPVSKHMRDGIKKADSLQDILMHYESHPDITIAISTTSDNAAPVVVSSTTSPHNSPSNSTTTTTMSNIQFQMLTSEPQLSTSASSIASQSSEYPTPFSPWNAGDTQILTILSAPTSTSTTALSTDNVISSSGSSSSVQENAKEGGHSLKADLIQEFKQLMQRYYENSHSQTAQAVNISDLKVSDISGLVESYNKLLAFEKEVLQLCKKAEIL